MLAGATFAVYPRPPVQRALQRFQVALKAFVVREGRLLLVREAEGERFWLATQPGSGPA